MKKIYFILCFLLFFVFSNAKNYRVLYIGNSYIGVNDLPSLIKDIVKAAGDTIEYSASTPGGCTFQQHLNQSISLIQQGDWDYVVLQEQSQLPSFPENQFMQESYPYAQQLCEQVRLYNPEAKIVFYMTWGRKNGDAMNCQYFPPLCTYEGMDSLLYHRYMMMAEDNDAYVSPVGYVWRYFRKNYPQIELYQSDESHPSLVGSYIAAFCFYTLIYEKDPFNFSFNSSIDQTVMDTIQSTVSRLVYDSLYKWKFPQDDINSIEDLSKSHFQVFPNPASKEVTISCSEFDYFDVFLYNANGNLIKCYKDNLGNRSISLDNLSNGIYFIQVSRDNKLLGRYKFIKAE